MGRCLSSLTGKRFNFIFIIGLLTLLYQWFAYVLFGYVYYCNEHHVRVLRLYHRHDYLYVVHKIDKNLTVVLEFFGFIIAEVEDEQGRALESLANASVLPGLECPRLRYLCFNKTNVGKKEITANDPCRPGLTIFDNATVLDNLKFRTDAVKSGHARKSFKFQQLQLQRESG
ncbi:hypothetical protein V6N13_107885 [Hibiscus sabdariffa]|uniref:Uncharacterized protein n=1 Tax=Hibiscus sabdariffa TaxID=183260 RepID=A0ABR2SQL0_9ROSI